MSVAEQLMRFFMAFGEGNWSNSGKAKCRCCEGNIPDKAWRFKVFTSNAGIGCNDPRVSICRKCMVHWLKATRLYRFPDKNLPGKSTHRHIELGGEKE